MKILLISSKFFGYSSRVSSAFHELGHDVDEIVIPSMSFVDRIKKKIFKKDKKKNTFIEKQLKFIDPRVYDKVFVFGGGAPFWLIRELKEDTHASFVLYLSADNSSYGLESSYFNLFDRVFTYSLHDSELYGFDYRPWFFSDEKIADKRVDISFVGSIHSDRYPYLDSLVENCSLKSIIYIYIDWLGYLKIRNSWKKLKRFIHFKGLSYNEYISLLAESKCTLDIPEKGQINITTRPIEALGTKTKVITTSKSITKYDFYNENNIFMIQSATQLNSIREWLSIPYEEIDERIINNYRISKWAKDVLS